MIILILKLFLQTGTLTHDGLDMNSVLPCDGAIFSKPVINIRELDSKSELVKAMATCHSITRIDGQLNGDPLDLNMFKFTGWVCIFLFARIVIVQSCHISKFP